MKPKNAVILAAGLGSRLLPITQEAPKCLTEFCGSTITERALDSLQKLNVENVAIVIGYLGDVIINHLGNEYKGMKISYIWNEDYKTTNSMYSVYLARDFISKGCYLLEGDVVFDSDFTKLMTDLPPDKTFWMVDRFGPESSGSMSIVDENDRIKSVQIVREELPEYKNTYFKSCGILKMSPSYGIKLTRWLEAEVKENNVNVYFDNIIAKHLDDPIYIKNVEQYSCIV